MTTQRIELPEKLVPVFSGAAFVRGAHGGRGAGKTRAFALMAAIKALLYATAGVSGIILCGREYMNSLDDSSMEEIKQAISETEWLVPHFDVGEKYIRTKCRRVSFVFAGLSRNLDSIKSKARILMAWVDEAESVSEAGWVKLIPTIRGIDDAELWVTWNPERRGSPADVRFRQKKADDAKIVEINYPDNPWFPAVLERARLEDRRIMSDALYRHVWEGDYYEQSDAQVFRDKYVCEEFEPQPEWDGPYFGLDFGFAQDPTAAVKCWIADNRLYIERESGKVGLELDDTASYIAQEMPEIEQHIVRADSARPESISYLKRHGLPRITAVKKWPGSVVDGISHMRSYSHIVIHPRCVNAHSEFRLYSYKVDRLSGDVLPQILDENNHYIDAIRYAIAPLIQSKGNVKPMDFSFFK